MKQTETLVFKYDGEALEQHKISISLLADSLQGICSLMNEINIKLNGTSDNLDVKVDAFKQGSFEVVLDVIQNPQEYTEILSIIGIGGSALAAGKDSLLTVMSRLNGRQIKKLSFAQNGDCKVTFEGGEGFDVPPYLKPLLASASIRKSLSKLIHTPLQEDGIDTFKVLNSDGEEVAVIDKEQSSVFKYRRVPVDQTSTDKKANDVLINFVTIHKDKSTFWRIDYEGETVTATIKDDEFVAKVKNGLEPELFSAAYSANLTIREDLYSLDKTYLIDKVHGIVD
ncbi:hypothetical protein [Photobacterium salinisoli]|uniref:hypothetical protein n=1 Tax=Photobacterium salinisoli TaxID=1616783 RepID=UPI000EA3E7F0|nr:hypothetical protein [Photobacterium salinisoli]